MSAAKKARKKDGEVSRLRSLDVTEAFAELEIVARALDSSQLVDGGDGWPGGAEAMASMIRRAAERIYVATQGDAS